MTSKQSESLLKYTTRTAQDIEKDLINNYNNVLDIIRAKLTKLYEKTDLNKSTIVNGGQLEILNKQIENELIQLQKDNYKIIDDNRYDVFENTYSELFEGSEVAVTKLNTNVVTASLENPLYNANFASSMESLTLESLKKISNSITNGIIQGNSLKEIMKDIKESVNISAKRAITIARTETFRAYSQGQLKYEENLKEKGYKFQKYWMYSYVIKDSRPSHIAMDGKPANEDGFFVVDGVKMEAPRLSGDPAQDINCRCSYYSELVPI